MSLKMNRCNFKQISDDKKFSLKDKVEFSIKAAGQIDNLHQENIFYKNLTSESFLYDWIENRIILKDSDYTSSEELNRLLYISPEQTGRINRVTDYRTDIYSFGIILFRLFAKKYPFEYTDPLQIIHAHIAKVPKSVSSVNALIPISLSKIIEKLLKKEPEDRYQSINGISFDLEKVLFQLNEEINVEFKLATNDISHRPNVPETLYGREKEKEKILKIFENVLNNDAKELLTIKGYSGIGKTSLVQTIHKEAIKENIYFLNAKFEQFNQNIPYYGLIIVFQEYIHNLLLSSEYKLKQFKEIILNSLGDNTKLICEIIPKLELIIGEIPSCQKLNPKETQNRFNLTFLTFIKTICDFEDSLVIALDDIQWIDNGTLHMLNNVLEDEKINSLMIILSYRDNEVSNNHKVELMLNNLKHTDHKYSTIILESLSNSYISQIVEDTLFVKNKKCKELVDLLEEKTSGNPFFIKEFLYNLYDEKLLKFDSSNNCWSWDIKKIKAKNITNNVADLMIKKVESLSSISKELLPYFSCLVKYNNIDYSEILDTDKLLINKAIVEAVELGLLISLGYKDNSDIRYKFSHDKVQEAVYSLLDEENKKEIHFKIGKHILDNTLEENLEKNIFDIVEHLNLSSSLIFDEDEKYELAQYNLIASKKAKNSNAYANSITFLNKALELLGKKCWEENYSLSLKIYSELCESSYLSLRFKDAYKYFELTKKKCLKINDKIKISQIQIFSLIAQNKMSEALELGLDIINEFGIYLPFEDDINIYYPELFKLYENKEIDSLLDLCDLKDQNKIDILEILNSIMAPAYLSAPHIYPKICFAAVKLCILNGNCKASANVYAVHSLLLCGFFQEYSNGSLFAQLSLDILSKYNTKADSAKVEMISNACVFHWNKHISNSLENLKSAVVNGLDIGDFEYACYSAMYYTLYSIFSGKDIAKIIDETSKYLSLMKDLKQEYQIHYTSIWQQFLINLNSSNKDSLLLEGKIFSEKKSLDLLIKSDNISTLYCYYLSKAMLGIYFNDAKSSFDNIIEAKKYLMGVISLYHFNEFYIFEAIIYYKNYKENKKIDKNELLKLLNSNLEYYKKQKKSSASNNKHKVYAIKGMIKDIDKKDKKSWFYFDKAIEECEINKFIHFSTIYNELLGINLIKRNRNNFANIYLNNAYISYKEWKAYSVANVFFKRYEEYITIKELKENTDNFNFDKFDLESVTKASLAISEEISLESLLDKIMTIIIENSGSQIGALILNNDDTLKIETSYDLYNNKNNSIKELSSLPKGLINYVKRSQQQLLYNSKDNVKHFDNVSYIKKYKPKSIFCMPITYKQSFLGILYLENREINNLYSSNKIALLKVLSTQAVISIEHAKLFKQTINYSETLESKVKEKTKELHKAIEKLRIFATIDSMTGLNNRRYFFELGIKMFQKAKSNNKNLCSLLLDIDNFKDINDTYGHNIGDLAIKFFAKKIETYNNHDCIVGRLGGDEFVFLIYGKDDKFIKDIIAKIKDDISILYIKEQDLTLNMTTSIGYTFLNEKTQTLDELILESDCKMYEEKNSTTLKIRRR